MDLIKLLAAAAPWNPSNMLRESRDTQLAEAKDSTSTTLMVARVNNTKVVKARANPTLKVTIPT